MIYPRFLIQRNTLSLQNLETHVAHLSVTVEYAIHCLIWLADQKSGVALSIAELAVLQGVPSTSLAKIFPGLEKAGIVISSVGLRGGYRLARPPEQITFLEIIDAVEVRKPLFVCREIRGQCGLFNGEAPVWAKRGTCAIHAAMIRAEKAFLSELEKTTLNVAVESYQRASPESFRQDVDEWISDQIENRGGRRQPSSLNREDKP